MAHPGKSPVRIRSRVSLADAALMRLEAKRAKGPAGVLVPEDLPPPPATAAAPPAPKPEKASDVAARLDAALKGHLEHVAAALASVRSEASKPVPRTAGRSIYAPGAAGENEAAPARAEADFRLPPATPLAMDPLPPPADLAPEPVELPAPVAEAGDIAEEYEEEYAGEFGHDPLAWMSEEGADDEEPLPAALLRHSRRDAEPVGHLPPLIEPAGGISARTLAVAALFGLAAGVGAIAAYQFSVAPVAVPAVASAVTHPPVDTSKIAKLDADRVPQSGSEPAVKVAAAGAGSVVARLAAPAAPATPSGVPVVAAADAAPVTPPPVAAAPAEPAEAGAIADRAPATLRRTEDAGAAVAAAEEAPSDTERFVATAAVRPAQPRTPASASEVLAYAPTPKPNDPVGRSFFGKDDGEDAAPAAKKSASAKIPAPSPGKAKVLMAVNMRAKPDNDAPAVKILGAGTRVQVVKCDGWCEIVADGRHGYVFKKFLDN